MAFDSGFGAPINFGWNFGDVPIFNANAGPNPGPGANAGGSTIEKIFAAALAAYQTHLQADLTSQQIKARQQGRILYDPQGRLISDLGFPESAGFSLGGSFWLIAAVVVVLLLFRR